MISKIKINNLKSFEDVTLELKNLTLLVGMNSAGKSTVIQSLLLAMQNINEDGRSPLNGRLVSLGEFSDVRNYINNAKSFSIRLSSKSEDLSFLFKEDSYSVVCEVSPENSGLHEYLNYKNKKIHYLSSKRIGSQDLYGKNYDKFNDYGILGEYAIDYFDKNKSEPIQDYLIKDKSVGSTLGIQVNYWLKYIVNSELQTEDITDTDTVKAKFLSHAGRYVRPKNIGSGLSYIVSILISILSSQEGELIIIENPEIHLHPKAQSKLTELMSYAAQSGVKLIIETHSDHIFNGVRKSVYKDTISQENLGIYFFSMDENEYLTKATNINIDTTGNVVNHQDGLFDQFDDDLDELLGLK